MPQHLTQRKRDVLLVLCIFACCVPPGSGQTKKRAKYCSGEGTAAVIFLTANTGVFTDGAVDTGMGVYRAHTDCKWVIQPIANENVAPVKHRVVVHFEYLNIESGFDFLTVFENNEAGKLLGRFTGSSLPPTVVASVDTLYIRFRTDGTGQRLGFKARWDTLGCPNACGNRGSCVRDYCYCDEGYFGGDCSSSFCVGTKRYTSIIGNMMDHYRTLDEDDNLVLGDYTYKNNVDCRWLLQPLKLFSPYFTLEFMLMDTEVGRDLLVIFDGANQNAPVLAQISGANISMPLLTSSGEDLFLQFTSDKLKSNLGFFAYWDTMKECGGGIGFCHDGGVAAIGGHFRQKRGYCFDAEYYPPQHIVKGKCLCHYGWYGGDCSFKWCLGSKILTRRIGSFIDHHDEYVTADGITTPIATLDYNPSSFCRWTIKPVDPINFIVLRFEYFELESGSDFLFVHDGDYFDGPKQLMDYNHSKKVLDGTLTGDGAARMPQQVILSQGTNLFLNFQSDDANTNLNRGFKATYEGVFCYGRVTLSDQQGVFSDGSPTVNRYYPRTYCLWQVKPDDKYFVHYSSVIEIDVQRMNIGMDTVTVYDGDSIKSPILEQFTGKIDDIKTITGSGREMTIEFETLCHSGPNCRDCKRSCLMTGCCDKCTFCDNGRAPRGIGMNLYGKDIPEPEFLNENCMCDLIPPLNAGWKMSYKVTADAKFCRKEFPRKFDNWFGDFWGFENIFTYRNNEDCTWLLDIDPKTAGGDKVEKLDIYLEMMNTDSGRGIGKHPTPDVVTVYKGHERTTNKCYGKCVTAVNVQKWGGCPESLSPQPDQRSCMLTQQDGPLITCDKDNQYTYHISCWSSPRHWTIALAKAMVTFQSSEWFVGGNFKISWVAEIVNPILSVATGMGTVMTVAGESAVFTVRTRWTDQVGIVQNRTTGGSDCTMMFSYTFPIPLNATIYSQAKDNGDGTYDFAYVPKYSGVHTLYVRAFGKDIAGSPFTVVVTAGKVDPTKCMAWDTKKVDLTMVGGLTGGKAGREYAFKLQCHDEYNNLIMSRAPIMEPFYIKIQGLKLFWGWVDYAGAGIYDVFFNVPVSGKYEFHVLYKFSPQITIAITGNPFPMEIDKVPCPVVGAPVACNGQGRCDDTGKCHCGPGWTGEYCQDDLAMWLRMGIVIENAAIGVFLFTLIFNYVWQKCVTDKQLFDRLAHDDTEQDW